MNKEQTATAQPEYPTLNAIVAEGVKFVETMGKAISSSIQNLPDFMIVNMDDDIRSQIDALVDAGIVENRREGAKFLIKEGLENHTGIFDKIDETKTKIAALRQQLQEIAKGEADEVNG
ncbi:MAG: hypothetical protein B6I38_10155 [Anaerolineaceae bacterium 4572_5.1]|nr:MAG: hypothetical protein B6I38_10155 [Anaerolineaceae bacterium 4572_5.1]